MTFRGIALRFHEMSSGSKESGRFFEKKLRKKLLLPLYGAGPKPASRLYTKFRRSSSSPREDAMFTYSPKFNRQPSKKPMTKAIAQQQRAEKRLRRFDRAYLLSMSGLALMLAAGLLLK
jgi:hypothetical protein